VLCPPHDFAFRNEIGSFDRLEKHDLQNRNEKNTITKGADTKKTRSAFFKNTIFSEKTRLRHEKHYKFFSPRTDTISHPERENKGPRGFRAPSGINLTQLARYGTL
jgi:hypothetical protein